MVRRSFIMIMGCIAAVTLSGCVTAKTYVINKPRVDQEIPGMPEQGAIKTRKVLVVEVIEKDKMAPKTAVKATPSDQPQVADHDSEAAPAPAAVTVSAQAPKVSTEEKNFTLPQSSVPEIKPEPVSMIPQEYVVEKDDTLQKISKKVYGTYSKWTKIYDANRDVLKDPNFLKPGKKLKIPSLESMAAPVVTTDVK